LNVTAPTEEDKRSLPELRHNMRLLCDTAKAEVQGLAKEGQALRERKAWVSEETTRTLRRKGEEETKRRKLEEIVKVVKEVGEIGRKAGGMDEETERLLEMFEEPLQRLCGGFEKEYEEMRLDEVAVAGIAPIVSDRPASSSDGLVLTCKNYSFDERGSNGSRSSNRLFSYLNSNDGERFCVCKRMPIRPPSTATISSTSTAPRPTDRRRIVFSQARLEP